MIQERKDHPLYETVNQILVEATLDIEGGTALAEQVWHDLVLSSPGSDLLAALVQAASQNSHLDPNFALVAARLRLRQIYRNVLGQEVPSPEAYRQGFIGYIRSQTQVGRLDARLAHLDLARLAQALVPERDRKISFTGLTTLEDRYLVQDLDSGRVLELPQYLFMRVALGLALVEENPEDWAIQFYQVISNFQALSSTPTLFNAGTSHPQLSSCYVADVEDSLESILGSAQEFGLLAKYAGGIGTSITKLRAQGSPVKGVDGYSSGIIPFINTYDALIKAISQGGRRRGTIAAYLEPWHLEIYEFLDLRKNSGDPYRRVRNLNTALWIPDLFMQRVKEGANWTLFDPAYVPGLSEKWGAEFETLYTAYESKAKSGEIPARACKEVSAPRLYSDILASLMETGHPWITFKDAANLGNALPGMIHSSNLCTEIFLPTSKEEIAVCNLASVNLAQHLKEGSVDWEKLAATVKTTVRMLDNVIDQNLYPAERARYSNLKNRPVGLGVMGLAEVFSRLGLVYGSETSLELSDQIFEFISYHAIATSCALARERGAFPSFSESAWAQGRLPKDRNRVPNQTSRLDWESLRQEVKQGIRNGTVMAIAPTATISLISGTSPGIDPYYANVFARNNLSGKFTEINPVLVAELQQLGRWQEFREKIIEARGDLKEVPDMPAEIAARYPTAYEISPEAYILVAARAQKWVDQGVSRNLYAKSREIKDLEAIYLTAWEQGLKSTYYLYMAPRMHAEQSTVAVNKSVKKPKWNLETLPEATSGETCESCQ